MAITANKTVLSPLQYSASREIVGGSTAGEPGLRTIAQALNWSFQERWICHVSMTVAPQDWDDYAASCGTAGSTIALNTYDATATATETSVLTANIWLDEDPQTMELGTECFCPSGLIGDAVTVRCRLAGGVGTVSWTVTRNGTQNQSEGRATQTLSTISNGNEWVLATFRIQRTAGSAPDNEVRTITLEEFKPASIPIPDND